MDEASRLRTAQRTGRRIGIVVFSAIVASFVVVCSAQILYQGFHVPVNAEETDCRAEIRSAIRDIRKARAAAEVEVLGERAAMANFRSAIGQRATKLRTLENQCRSDIWARDALRAVDEWRWAEESAVRYESVDLAPSRRNIRRIEASLGPQPIRVSPIHP